MSRADSLLAHTKETRSSPRGGITLSRHRFEHHISRSNLRAGTNLRVAKYGGASSDHHAFAYFGMAATDNVAGVANSQFPCIDNISETHWKDGWNLPILLCFSENPHERSSGGFTPVNLKGQPRENP